MATTDRIISSPKAKYLAVHLNEACFAGTLLRVDFYGIETGANVVVDRYGLTVKADVPWLSVDEPFVLGEDVVMGGPIQMHERADGRLELSMLADDWYQPTTHRRENSVTFDGRVHKVDATKGVVELWHTLGRNEWERWQLWLPPSVKRDVEREVERELRRGEEFRFNACLEPSTSPEVVNGYVVEIIDWVPIEA
jgi:hypothetical protein